MKHRNNRHTGKSTAFVFESLEKRELMSAGYIKASAVLPARAVVESVSSVAHRVKSVVTGTGLTAEYFSNTALTAGALVRTDSSINISGRSPFATSLRPAAGAQWTGSIQPSVTDNYYFSVVANGPVTLSVNGIRLIQTTTAAPGMIRSTSPLTLVAGTKYSVAMTYSKAAGTAPSVKLLWAGKHVKQSVVPQSALYPSGTATVSPVTGGLIGQYFLGTNFQTPAMTRVDATVNFNFGTSSPNAAIPAHSPYSIRWTGQVTAPVSGTYTFSATAANGIRVYVGDSLLISNWSPHSAQTNTATIALTAGQSYDFRVDYYQNGSGLGSAQVDWAVPGGSLQPIPASAFTSTPPAIGGTLSAAAVSDSEIDLSWTGSATAAGYRVEQSTDGGASFQTVATTTAGTSTFADTGLTAATAYAFKVIPTGSADTSTPSNLVVATTLTTTPASLVATPVSASVVRLTWANVAGANGYDILAESESSATGLSTESVMSAPVFTQIGTAPAGATSFDAPGLSAGTNYLFEVEGISPAGAPSLPTAPANAATVPSPTSDVVNPSVSADSVTINWMPVTGATGYLIESSPDGSTGWFSLHQVGPDVLTYVDDSVTPGVAAFYRIVSIGAGGDSVPSQWVTAVPLTDAPTGVTAAPFSSSQINLSWSEVPDEDGFVVLLDQPNTAPVPIATLAAGVLTDSVTGLLPGTSYTFAVESLNSAGTASDPSTTTTGVTTPVAPANLVVGESTQTSASLTWTDVPSETGFTIQSAATPTGAWTTVSTIAAGTITYTDNTLSAGQTRFYRVLADDAGGLSAPSPIASATTIPAAPVASLTGLSTAQSQVTWPAVNGATSYTIERSTTATGAFTAVSTVAGTSTSTAVTNLLPSTTYYYKVVATDATGPSTPSAPVGQMTAPSAQYQTLDQYYGLTATAGIFDINMTAGSSVLIGQTLSGAYDMRRDPLTNDLFYYINTGGSVAVYTWDPTTGNNTVYSNAVTNPGVGAFESNGNAFVIDTTGNLSEVNRSPHVSTPIGTVKTVTGTTIVPAMGNMMFNATGNLFLLNSGSLYEINQTTAAATLIAQLAYGNITGVFGDNDALNFTTPTGGIYGLNLTNLTATLLGTGAPSFIDLAASPLFDNLSLSVTGGGSTLTHGTTATYTIAIDNAGPQTEVGPTTVTTTLPTGITFVSATGTEWTSSVSGSTVTLTYTGPIQSGAATPVATLNVAIGSTAIGARATFFSVEGQLFDINQLLGSTTIANTVI